MGAEKLNLMNNRFTELVLRKRVRSRIFLFFTILILSFPFIIPASTLAAAPVLVSFGDGTIVDSANNLVWLKEANCFGAPTWDGAMASANSLANGQCGLTDGSNAGDWHLPTVEELRIFTDNGLRYDSLNAAGFSNVQSYYYWSSSYSDPTYPWFVSMSDGNMSTYYKYNGSFVWPVRVAKSWSAGSVTLYINPVFGSKNIGTTAAFHTVNLFNRGTNEETVSSLAIVGTNAAEFTLTPGGSSPCGSLTPTLAAGGSCTLELGFSPTSAGVKSASLGITVNGATSSGSLSGSAFSTISGTVTDQATGQPVPDATVSFDLSIATTDGNGNFSFGELTSATYDISVTKNGYQTTGKNGLVVSSSASPKVDILLPTVGILNITTYLLPSATAGEAYARRVMVAGGVAPYSFSIAYGTLPDGLTLDTATGAITGMPVGSGNYTFAVGVADSATGYAEAEYTIYLVPTLEITTASLPRATLGAYYSTIIAASGGQPGYTYTVTEGNLAVNTCYYWGYCWLDLTLNSATGEIYGAISGTTPRNFTVTVIDSTSRAVSRQFTIGIDEPLNITVSRLPTGLANTAYSQPLSASGGYGTYSWSISDGTLPAGISLNATTGLISGQSAITGTFPITVTVQDTVGRSMAQPLTLNITSPFSIATTSLAAGYVGSPYTRSISTTGGVAPFAFSYVGTLPPGLSLDPGSGTISGTPTAVGLDNISVTVSDSSYPAPVSATRSLSLRIWSSFLITNDILPDGIQKTAYSSTLSGSGGTLPYLWRIESGSLPGGMTLNSSTGILSGTPTTCGTFSFTAGLADSYAEQRSVTKPLAITVACSNDYVISGNAGIAGASVAYHGTASGTVTATEAGAFSIGPLSIGTYTITPAKPDYAFSPVKQTTTIAEGLNVALTPFTAVYDVTPPVITGFSVAAVSAWVQPITGFTATDNVAVGSYCITETNSAAACVWSETAPTSHLPSSSGGKTLYAWVKDTAGNISLPATAVVTVVTPAPVLATGQTQCYDTNGTVISCAGTGQDGDLQAGTSSPNPRFTDQNNGTLKDNLTGLVWLKDANCFGSRNWWDALNSANTLASGACSLTDSSTAGQWRLPNKNELQSLVNRQQDNQVAWLTEQGFGNVQNNVYWSSSNYNGNSSYFWLMHMGDGINYYNHNSVGLPIWPVRDDGMLPRTGQRTSYGAGDDGALQKGVPWPEPRFTDNNNGTITDNLTDLIWLKDATCFSNSWYAALSIANSLASGICGLTDGSTAGNWKLPNINELKSLIDTGQNNLSLPVGHPFNVTNSSYWSSTTFTNVIGYALTANMGDGYLANGDKYYNSRYVWPVRVGKSWSAGFVTLQANPVFSSTAIGTTAAFHTVRLFNRGTSEETVSSLTITGTNATEFTLAPGGSNPCSSLTPTLAAGGSCTLQLGFSPTYTGVKSASLGITVNGATSSGMLSGSAFSTISGSVTDQATGQPVPDATVTFGLSIATTDGNGRFTFGDLPAATYDISVSKGGYQTTVKSGLVVSSSASPKVDILLPTVSILNITTHLLPSTTAGEAYARRIMVAGGTAPYSFSIAYGSLPDGLTLDTATGAVTGMPSGSGSNIFAVGVADSAGGYAEAEYTVYLVPTLEITTTSLPRATRGTYYSTSIAASGGQPGYTYTITGGNFTEYYGYGYVCGYYSGYYSCGYQPMYDLTLNAATGDISGNISGTTPRNFTVTVTDSTSRAVARQFSIGIDDPLAITVSQLSTGLANTNYSQSLSAYGGYGAYSWSVSDGTLPAGISLNATTGLISGQSAVTGSFPITLTVMDVVGRSVAQTLTLNITTPLTITTTALAAGYAGVPYTQGVSTTGGVAPFTFSYTGTLPPGLSIDPSSGTISGTPTAAGLANISISVIDSTYPSPVTVTKNVSLRMFSAPVITTSTIPNGMQKAHYSATLYGAGGTDPRSWSIASGALPAEVTLESSTGILSGTPAFCGVFPVNVRLTDAATVPKFMDKSLTLNISCSNDYSISGNTGVAGATIYYSGPTSGTVTADSNGSFSISPLSLGTYTITPSSSRYLFTPQSASVYIENDFALPVFTAAPDQEAPVVTSFTIPAVAVTATIKITTFTATDSTAVTGYMLTETATAPAATASVWSTGAPVSYTFSDIPDGVATTKTLYAWAKDESGNVSSPTSATTTITVLKTSGMWQSLGLTGKDVISVAVDPTDSLIVYAGTRADGAFKSTDGGASWFGINSGMFDTYGSGSGAESLLIDPTNPQTIYAGTGMGVFKSTNGGNSWIWTYSLSWSVVHHAQTMVFDPHNSQTIYAGSNSYGVYKSTNGGVTWGTANNGMTNTNETISSIVIDPANGQTIYAATWSEGVLKSTNGGGSWTAINNGINVLTVFSLAIDPTNSQILYAGTNYGLFYKSVNGGASWTIANNGLMGRTVVSLAVDPTNSQTIYAGTFSAGVFLSTNGGETWTATNYGVSSICINALAVKGEMVYAAATGGIYKSLSTTPPRITEFTLPATASTITIPVTTFTASDNVAVTGYLLTETNLVPSSSNPSWSIDVPTSYTFNSIPVGTATLKTLYAWVKDAAGNISSSSAASTTITLPDVSSPTIMAFTVPTTVDSLVVPIDSLVAYDNVAVTGYLITETATPPALSSGWSTQIPASHTFATNTSGGSHSLFAWVRDAAGNVSPSVSRTVSIAFANAQTLSVTVAGTGDGTVNSTESNLSCDATTCSASYDNGTIIRLFATPGTISLFTGWSGACTGEGTCLVTMNSAQSVTATFSSSPNAIVGAKVFENIQAAYDDSATADNAVIKLLEGAFTGGFTAGRNITVTLEGGYNAAYTGISSETAIKGTVVLKNGTVKMRGVQVR